MTEANQTRHIFVVDTNLSLWPCIHSAVDKSISSKISCITSRLAAIVILFVSLICFVLNIRFLLIQRGKHRRNGLVISLSISSLLVLLICVPGVLIQMFTCRRLCIALYCRIEGFVSYTSGCVCMLALTILSVHRYLSLCEYNISSLHKWSALGCWIFCIIWTLPPLLGCWNFYVPEGLGFHCSLEWEDPSRLNRLYIFFSFLCVYFIPLIVLFTVNIRVHRIVHAVYSMQGYLLSPSNQYHLCPQKFSLPNDSSSSTQRQNIRCSRECHSLYRSTTDYWHTRAAQERRRLRITHRFVRAIIFLVGAYVFAWTPYAIIALFQLFRISAIFRYPSMVTFSAFIAKFSVILTPFAYLGTMNFRLLKIILFHPRLENRNKNQRVILKNPVLISFQFRTNSK